MTARLAVTGLVAHRGSEAVLCGLDLFVDPGEMVLVTGPNGSGKSTLLETVAGVLPAAAGEIRLDGDRIEQHGADRVARMGVSLVPQERHLFGSLTVHENLELAQFAAPRRGDLERVPELLARLGIARLAATPAGLLSGGEQRLVALARGLRSRPRLLLLDEPLAALAVDIRDLLVRMLRDLADRTGTAILVVEHDHVRCAPAADRVLALRRGVLHAPTGAAP